ncbi:Positive regulator of purine utilization [Acrodontium crateriforme]|uniref:Positive regulator of purine utilization n=1 Tax=Acrodontium crateriforme TaxID=150365 RepID=A0AAQ3M519_9PEZI|nr:Positive regulator of purine utilization [Acrodontium crateriforme]
MKRERDHNDEVETVDDDIDASPTTATSSNEQTSAHRGGSSSSISTTNFRNVSACNRCRNRKNRCDQKLPRCSGCAKADVKCVGFDPVSKREIPRSYVYYLETRVITLEALLRDNNVPCPPPSEDFSISDAIKPGQNVPFPAIEDEKIPLHSSSTHQGSSATLDPALQERDDDRRSNKSGNTVNLVAARSPVESRNYAKKPGIAFSRVVFAAVKSSVPHSSPAERLAVSTAQQLPSSTASGGGGSSSFFALHTKPAVKAAPFPERNVGQRLAELYFEHANPQIPILHRPKFMALFDRVYSTDDSKRTPRELYLLNMVFAIGSGIINDTSNTEQGVAVDDTNIDPSEAPNRKRMRIANHQRQPEEYHAAAIVHLDGFLGSPATTEGVGGGLEELQAVLLLAGLALLRPVAPGLWYIIGVAVRLAIDLGLHFEDVDPELDSSVFIVPENADSKAPGRKQWTRDFRRRLWWCTFSFDRLVSTCVGRPVGIIDQVITTAFPTILDDKDITPSGFLRSPHDVEMPTYKLVARHYFRLRLLQSEILQVLQYRQAEQTRAEHAAVYVANNITNESYMRTDLPSPFLHGFHSFRDWRADVDRRLWEWKESSPKQLETGVAFTPLFLELNYWQAVIMLYRQSLAVPEPLAGEMSPSTGEDVQSPGTANMEAKEDEQMVFMKVAQAGQTVLKIYRRLHRLKLVNYTFLATHHLFMSGISFLYAIWHSTLVRSQLTLDDVDFTVLVATSVLSDLIEKCPPAEACRDAFVRMSKATISMCMNTTGFGNASTLSSQPLNIPGGYFSSRSRAQSGASIGNGSPNLPSRRMRMPKFDMNLKDLFSEEEIANRPHTQDFRGNSPLPPQSPAYLMGSPRSTTEGASNQPFQNFNLHIASANSQHQDPDSSLSQTSEQLQNNTTSPSLSFPTLGHSHDHTSWPGFNHNHNHNTHTHTHNHNTSNHNNNHSNNTHIAEFPYQDFDFLDPSFTTTTNDDPTQSLWGELDLGFGTGGTAGGFDAAGHDNWDLNAGGVDLFDGFFFGNSGNSGGG